jgi:hypothetical protein
MAIKIKSLVLKVQFLFRWWLNLGLGIAIEVWTSQSKNLGHWNGNWNQVASFNDPNFFFNFFSQAINLGCETASRVWKGWPKNLGNWHGDRNQITSFNGPNFFFNFCFHFLFFGWRLNSDCKIATEVWIGQPKNLGYWDGDWNQVDGFNDPKKNSILFLFFYWWPNFGHRIAIKVWIGQLKNIGHWNGD